MRITRVVVIALGLIVGGGALLAPVPGSAGRHPLAAHRDVDGVGRTLGSSDTLSVAHRLFVVNATQPVGGYLRPEGVAVDRRTGTVYVVDTGNHRIVAHTPRGEVVGVIGAPGRAPGLLWKPRGADVGPDGSLYVADSGNMRVQRFAPDGTLLAVWGGPGRGDGEFAGEFAGYHRGPVDVAVGPDGTVYVADDGNQRFQRFSSDGAFIRAWDAWSCPGTAASVGDPLPPASVHRALPRGDLVRATVPMTSWAYVDLVLAAAPDGTVYGGSAGGIGRFTADGRCLGRFSGHGISPGYLGYPGPYGMDVAPDGDVYVADGAWGRVQRFGPGGEFRGLWYVPDATPLELAFGSDGTLFVPGEDRVMRFTAEGHPLEFWGRPSSSDVDSDAPRGVAVQADGSVWVGAGERIERYTADGAFLGFVGSPGNAPGRLSGARGMVVFASGAAAVAESGNDRIQVFGADGRSIVRWGGSQMREPSDLGIILDGWRRGRYAVAEAGGHRVSLFHSSGVEMAATGTRGAGRDEFDTPTGITATADGYWVADSGNDRLVFYDDPFDPTRVVGVRGAGPGEFDRPHDLAVGPDGEVYVADTGNHRVQLLDAIGRFVRQWGGRGREAGRFESPESVAVGADGAVYVADTGNHRIQRFLSDGTFTALWPTFGWARGTLHECATDFGSADIDVAGAPDGRFFVANRCKGTIQRFAADGRFESAWRPELAPDHRVSAAVSVSRDGRVFVLETGVGVVVLSADGLMENAWTFGDEADGWSPRDLTVGAQGDVFVLSIGSRDAKVIRFGPDGAFRGEWPVQGGNSGESYPSEIEAGPDGSLYIVNEYRHAVERYDEAGRFLSRWPAGGPRDEGYPRGIAVAVGGTVYVAGTGGAAVEAFAPDGALLGRIETRGGCEGDPEIPPDSSGEGFRFARQLGTLPDGTLLVAWSAGCVEAYAPGGSDGAATWRIEHFANPYLAESAVLVETAPVAAFDRAAGASDRRIPPRGSSARLEKQLAVEAPHRLDLDVAARGGVRVWVDDVLLLDAWALSGITVTRSAWLTAGRHRILAHHRDVDGEGRLRIDDRLIEGAPSPTPTGTSTRAAPTSATPPATGTPGTPGTAEALRARVYMPYALAEVRRDASTPQARP